VAALRLAPLSLVQAVSASGIAVLALLSMHGHPRRLALPERLAVAIALIGLLLLSLSLVGAKPSSHTPHPGGVVLWLGASAGAAVVLIVARIPIARAAALGLATGLLFADGDISAKLVSSGGIWLVALPLSLVVCYAAGTSVLQAAFQHGSALTAAGIATLVTNAVPIAAGFVLFDEALPHGVKGALQIAAFASIVGSAALLGGAAAADGAGRLVVRRGHDAIRSGEDARRAVAELAGGLLKGTLSLAAATTPSRSAGTGRRRRPEAQLQADDSAR
jgi:hypothetical protein